jgi:hypothetical protein
VQFVPAALGDRARLLLNFPTGGLLGLAGDDDRIVAPGAGGALALRGGRDGKCDNYGQSDENPSARPDGA